MRQAQIKDGVVRNIWEGTSVPPIAPDGWTFVDVTTSQAVKLGDTYDAATETFTPKAAIVNRRLTHADVLALLTPSEWAELNKFSPTAAGSSAGGTSYTDAQVFWGFGVFSKAAYIDLDDPRFGSIITLFTAKGILTPERAVELQQQMAARAASK